MSDTTQAESISRDDAASSINSILTRINRASDLMNQFVQQKLDNPAQLALEKEELTKDTADILKQVAHLSGREKLNFLVKLAPLVYWGPDVSATQIDDDVWLDEDNETESTSASNKSEENSKNYKALQEFLGSIADFDFTSEQLHLFLKKNHWSNYDYPPLITQRTIEAISRLPPSEAERFIGEINSNDIPLVIAKWPYQAAYPHIEHLLTNAHQLDGDDSPYIYSNIYKVIESWPSESQVPVIAEIIDRWESQDINAEQLFQLLQKWPVEQSFPLIKKAVEICNHKIYIMDVDYIAIATAMSNWPPEQALPILGLVESKGENEEQNDQWDVDRKKNIRDQMELTIIGARTLPLETVMIEKLKSSQSSLREITMIQVTENHPELFSTFAKDLVSAHDYTIVAATFDKILHCPLSTQYENIDTLLKCYSQSSLRRKLIGIDRSMGDAIIHWDENHRNKFIRTLLEKEYTLHNGLLLLDKVDRISEPDFISIALKYALTPDGSYSDVEATAKTIASKIVRTPETEKITATSVVDSIIHGATQDKISLFTAESLIETFKMGTLQDFLPKISPYARSFIQSFNLNSLEDIITFVKTHSEYVSKLAETPDRPASLTESDIPNVFTTHLTLYEADLVKEQGIDLATVSSEEDFKNIFEKLNQVHPEWKSGITQFCFKEAAERFGYKRMFIYIDRRQVDSDTHAIKLDLAVSRHDALHAYFEIEKIFAISGLTADQFYGNILNQVRLDDSTYEEGSAHKHFNSIVQTMNPNVQEIIQKAEKYQHISHLQELIETVKTTQQIFSSWNALKRYSDLEQELQQTEMLDVLVELRSQGKNRLCDYIEKLAFHPTSKVNMVAVREFLNQPDRHLAAEATHVRSDLHALKKPSNYVDIPYLDMDAHQLRDALVEGDMDAIKAFRPMEITYQIPIYDGKVYTSIVDLTKIALGSTKEGILPQAVNYRKLYGELESVFSADYTISDYLEGKPMVEGNSIDIQRLKEIVCNPVWGLKKVDWQEYVATVHNASSADAVLAGSDTAGCDAFGDGKNANYTFNLNCGRFTIQLRQKSGKLRTFAQSTLTKDKDIRRPIPEVIRQMRDEEKHLVDIIPPQILEQEQAYIAADNIEVANNFRTPNNVRIIEALYADFFGEYAKLFAEEQQLKDNTLIIGEETYERGFVKQNLGYLPELPNTFAPQAPVTYTDKHGTRVRTIDIQRGAVFLPRSIRILEPLKPAQNRLPLPNIPGIQYLSFEDTLQTAYLEGKIFSDNKTLISNLHGIENLAIAIEINNAAKNRPNLSVKHTNRQGTMDGYMFAYEGRMKILDDKFISPPDKTTGESVIYIADMSADHHGSIAGARTGKALADAFVHLYRHNYLERGNFIPIAAHAREKTSYRLIKNQLERLSEELHIKFEMQEYPPVQKGNDLMYPVIIRPLPMGATLLQ